VHKKNVLLAVTGGVAAYKILELLRALVKKGFNVKVVITRSGEKFVTPFSFLSLGAEEVFTDDDQFSIKDGSSIHLYLSRWADLIVVAPATANTIAKIASGISDNLLLTTILASKKPVLIAPAMNENMYLNTITQRNIELLKSIGYRVVEPDEGYLADLHKGVGRLKEIDELFEEIMYCLYDKPLLNKRILITAGSTREFLDPVRFITNASSGKMGFSLARVAKRLGGIVTLIYGDVKEKPPNVDELIHVETTDEMEHQVLENIIESDILVMAGAPADYKPETKFESKFPKENELTVKFVSTPDILKSASKFKENKIFVGFALQTEDLIENAKRKMLDKSLDFIVANSNENIGKDAGKIILMDRDFNTYEFEGSKEEIAEFIFSKILELRR